MTTPHAYSIVRNLHGHTGAVRAICDVNGHVVSGAMDATVICWDPTSIPLESIFEHSHWITALIRLDSIHEESLGCVGFVTGGMDTHVRIFTKKSTNETKCSAVLQGHTSGIISLAWTMDKNPILLSGSWDGTCRGWDIHTETCRFILPSHENGVCVLGLPDGKIATGSTGKQQGNQVIDSKIRIWHATSSTSYTVNETITDHQGPVRQLVNVDGIGFASCSNDGTIKLRSYNGEVLMSCSHPLNHEGKPGFVLGLTYVPQRQHLVSASEDCTARVWSLDGTCLQTIEHPTGLWCVAALENGDIATGSEDKSIRIFSASAEPNESLAAELAAEVSEAHIQKTRGPSAVEIEKLPVYEQRGTIFGKSDGMIQMFRRDNVAWACQWNGASSTWLDIGQVTGTGSGGVVDGDAYDMVIPVEIETPSGVRKLEIGYNQGQNPFTVAQTFIDKHFLNQSYLKEIADYISDRSANYQPPVIGDFQATTSTTATPVERVTSVFFPMKTFVGFDSTKISKLYTTLVQFNSTIEPTPLTTQELEQLAGLIQTLQNTSYYHSSSITRSQMEVILKTLTTWPASKVYPALDLCRLMYVHPIGAELLPASVVIQSCLRLGLATDAIDATRFLAIRVLVNMFLHPVSRNGVLAASQDIFEAVATFCQTGISKPLAVSIATILMNYTTALATKSTSCITSNALVVYLNKLVDGTLDEESFSRVLVSFATLAVVENISLPSMDKLQAKANEFPSSSQVHAILRDIAALYN